MRYGCTRFRRDDVLRILRGLFFEGSSVCGIEFYDDEEQIHAELALRSEQFIALHNEGEAPKITA